ncbi:5'-nucleotidase [Microbacterium profundi]|uniref:5'-nucleotidase n=1 Tax=Microbacterium profundi TaxID=450380 RepID=A0ABV3LHP1_9MICO
MQTTTGASHVAIVTASNPPSHERVIRTLKSWDVRVNDAFFLGGIEKARVLRVLRPHIFFDDQRSHLTSAADEIPSVHVPFGLVNIVDSELSDVTEQTGLVRSAGNGAAARIGDI